jgi:alpha-galactosidase
VPKIAFIGAGSVEFTRNLVGDILAFPELGDAELALHDIDAERLETAAALARLVADGLGLRPRVTATLDRRAALEGADYVINSVQVGGHAATVRDYEVPLRYGLRQTIGDTLGIGGIMRALRTAPVMLGIGRDMADVCPGAWLLNYTNPMAMLCWITYDGTPTTRIVGLCHSVQNTTRQLAEIAGVPPAEVSFVGAGINHQSFILRLERDGEDLYPLVDAAIERDPELRRRVRVDMYRRLGYFPTESSEHGAEYLPWYLRHDAEIERLRIPPGEYVRRSEENLGEFAQVKAEVATGQPIAVARSLEYASLIIHSMETGQPRVVYGNVRNTGQISNLPLGACVEGPCLVDANGVEPVRVGALPVQCAALNRTFLNPVELTVRAVLEGRRDHVHHAALLDPNTAASLQVDEIERLVDELLEAYAPGLPALA